MPKGQCVFPGAEFWLLKCPCMKGDSKHFKDRRAYDLYRKLHNKKCELGRNAVYISGGEPTNVNLVNTITGDKHIRLAALDIHKKLYE